MPGRRYKAARLALLPPLRSSAFQAPAPGELQQHQGQTVGALAERAYSVMTASHTPRHRNRGAQATTSEELATLLKIIVSSLTAGQFCTYEGSCHTNLWLWEAATCTMLHGRAAVLAPCFEFTHYYRIGSRLGWHISIFGAHIRSRGLVAHAQQTLETSAGFGSPMIVPS